MFNNYKEIVTKTVIGKGKKTFKNDYELTTDTDVSSQLDSIPNVNMSFFIFYASFFIIQILIFLMLKLLLKPSLLLVL